MATEARQAPAMTATVSGGGDASAANQETGNTALSSIDTKTPTLLNGRTPIVPATSAGVAVEPIVEPAHDAADDSNGPAKIGGRAIATTPTAVAASDRVNALFDLDGSLVARDTLLGDLVSGNASNTDGASTACIAAGAAGVKHYLTLVVLTNTSATAGYVEIKDGTTVKLTIPIPAGGGAVVPLNPPIAGSAATAWNFDPSAALTTVYCSMVGFSSKV